jgi:hypothetical protein
MKPLDFNQECDDAYSAMMPIRDCTLDEWVESKNKIDHDAIDSDLYLLNELECIFLRSLDSK